MRIEKIGESWRIDVPAKINLYLEVLGRRPDGFHELDTIMLAIDLTDRLEFHPRKDRRIELELELSNALGNYPSAVEIPSDHRNLIWQAAYAMQQKTGSLLESGLSISVHKRIPSEAGLGGGSANAAAALVGASLVLGNRWNPREANQIAQGLGSDINFFLEGSNGRSWLAQCTGRGERVVPIESTLTLSGVLLWPGTGCPTGKIFRNLDLGTEIVRSEAVARCLADGNVSQLTHALFNRLQQTAEGLVPEVAAARTALESLANGQTATMSGSGSTVFAICHDVDSACLIEDSLKGKTSGLVFPFHTWESPSIEDQVRNFGADVVEG